jgi:hypothetical protein
MKSDVYEQHQNCQVVIRYKQTPYQQMCGLYCHQHNKFIDWIKQDQANQLVQEELIQVHTWSNSDKKTRNKTKTSYLQKSKQQRDLSRRIKAKL